MDIVIATQNQGKLQEMNFLFNEYIPYLMNNISLLSLQNFPNMPKTEEDGNSFEENAIKKAKLAADFSGNLTIADDSGLVVDALNGKPGIFSARYAGENSNDEQNVIKLLENLKDIPKQSRTAHFVCVIAIALPNKIVGTFKGVCNGIIGMEPKGNAGFGYDPVFIRNDLGKTFAELPHDVKNRISHRAHAFEKAVPVIEKLINDLK